ncbi:YfiR/HmsC family protein [Aliikangiella coralliicola]|uniref:YfiR/HmsC family protein n=1 Tax=Aliikangiella coralliicola TaxID=2592383 RepID=UPI00143D2F9C|nr:YfiR/HmsC family protein [Aliikangiella coralliicola]
MINKNAIILGLLLTCTFSSAQQNISPEEFKTAFIFHLLEKIEWKNQSKIRQYKIGIVGDYPELLSQLKATARHKRIGNKTISVTSTFNIQEMPSFHLLFIPVDTKFKLDRISSVTARSNTLLVTEDTADKKNTMINLLQGEDGTYSFEVNKANITFEYLKLNRDILLLGGTEMDVAELFKESSAQLATLKEELKLQQDTLETSKQQLAQSQKQYEEALKESERIRIQMKKQAKLLEEKTRLIEAKNISIREKEGELLAIQNELRQASDLLKSNEAILGEKLNTIASKEKEVSSLTDRINTNLSILSQQRNSIEKQKLQLKEQQKNLVEQVSQIEKQRWWLATSAIVLVIFVLLLMMIVYFNKERKKANLQLVDKNLALNKIQKELLIARDQAQAANEAKSSFLANMSHEIRTPMNAVIGMLHLTKQTNLNNRQENYINKIDNAANTLLEIINDILDFSKVEAGELKMESIEFSLSNVLDDLSNLIGLKIQQKGLEFIYEIDSKIPDTLVGDPLRLSQILINLTNNAMKFTEAGEVKVKIDAKKRSDNKIELFFEIIDTGIGMTKEVSSRLFRPFSQADSSTTRKFGGTGLGLAICKKLIEQMSGSINVDSHPNAGSNFSFNATFGFKTENSLLDRLDDSLGLSNKRILIVADNLSCQTAIRAILNSFGCQISVAGSIESCLGILKSAQKIEQYFDNILVDHQIALAHTSELRKIKSDTRSKLTLLLSGVSENEEILMQEISPDMTIRKPITPSSMLDTLVQLFDDTQQHIPSRRFSRFIEQDKIKPLNTSLENCKVLIVEDNEINQEVAKEILSQAFIDIDVASNGLEAVQKVSEKHFDCVLMDIQMPVMDGYQAARAIRESHSFSDLPIIAMTANAMGGDKEKCLSAGMNDYVSKPIRIKEFFETLNKWVISAKTGEKLRAIVDSTKTIESKIKIHGVDFESGVDLMGDADIFIDLLIQYKSQQSEFISKAKALLDKRDFDQLAKSSHDLKGVSANLFINQVSEIAAQLNNACTEHNFEEAHLQLGRLSQTLPPLLSQIQEYSEYSVNTHAS